MNRRSSWMLSALLVVGMAAGRVLALADGCCSGTSARTEASGGQCCPAKAPATAQSTLSVKVMTCADCVAEVTRALQSVKGVKQARVDLQSATAEVSYDPKVAGVKDLVSAVRKAGFFAMPVKRAPKR